MTGPSRRTVAEVDARVDKHEAECALRYDAIHEAIQGLKEGPIADLKHGMKWVIGGIWSSVLALLCWSLVQLYQINTVHRAEPAAQVQGR